MRKLLLMLFVCLSLCACSKSVISPESQENKIDIDISQMTSTVADSYLAQITEENNFQRLMDEISKFIQEEGSGRREYDAETSKIIKKMKNMFCL